MAAEKKPADKKTTKKAADKKATSSKAKKSPYGEGSLQTMGQPRKWPTEKALQNDFIKYIEHCQQEELLPNISGFCVFVDVVADTFYDTRRYYPDTYKKVRQALEDSLIQNQKFGQRSPVMAIVQGKNTFKWDDSGKGQSDLSLIDVDFDADSLEIDNYMAKLGYLPVADNSTIE